MRFLWLGLLLFWLFSLLLSLMLPKVALARCAATSRQPEEVKTRSKMRQKGNVPTENDDDDDENDDEEEERKNAEK